MSDFDSDVSANFVAITGATLEEARNWLEIGGFVLEDAVNLYFSSKSNDVGSQQTNRTQRGDSFDFDQNEDEVRRPDEVKRRKLLDFEYERINNIGNMPRAASAFSAGSNFVPKNAKEATLSKIFKAPVELMFSDRFDDVLDMAKDQDKWLVANLQTDSEFQCHTLNRDFWGDETIKDLILVSSLFWQHVDTTTEGSKYVNRYKITQYPHIAIIDPRTGAIAWRHDGRYEVKLLAEKFQDFLTQQTCPSESKLNNKLRRFATNVSLNSNSSSGQSSTNGGVAGAAGGVGFENGSVVTAGDDEDADIEAAIRLSLQQEQLKPTELKPHVDEPAATSVKDLLKPSGGSSSSGSDSATNGNVVSSSSSNSSSTAAAVSKEFKAKFQLPCGIKISKSFSADSSGLEVAVFAAEQLMNSGDGTARFEVYFDFPSKLLSEVENLKDKTLTDAGIPSGTVFFIRLVV